MHACLPRNWLTLIDEIMKNMNIYQTYVAYDALQNIHKPYDEVEWIRDEITILELLHIAYNN